MEKNLTIEEGAKIGDLEAKGFVKVKLPTRQEKTAMGLRQAGVQKKYPEKVVRVTSYQKDENGEYILDKKGEPVKTFSHVDENESERNLEVMNLIFDDFIGRISKVDIKVGDDHFKDAQIFHESDEVFVLFVNQIQELYTGKKLGK